jgi:ADP-ribose pyrophosphatase YjhB (NUDIX family)
MSREYPQAPVVGVGAVILDGDRVLLIRRGSGQFPVGRWK